MYPRRKKYTPKPFIRRSQKPRTAPRRKYTSKKVIKRVVRSVVSRQAEKKSVVYSSTLSLGTLQPTTSSLIGNYIVITPSQSSFGYTIAKGTDDNQRIGNQINIKTLRHTFVCIVNPYNATTNTQQRPCYIRFYYFKSKWSPVADVATGNVCGTNANFFDNSSSDTGFSGALMDLTRKIQSQNYTYLCHRTFKIGNSQPPAAMATSSIQANQTSNDFKMSMIGKVNLARFCKSKFTFNDANQVMNPWIHCLMQVMAADGSVISTTQSQVSIQSQIYCEYTDE